MQAFRSTIAISSRAAFRPVQQRAAFSVSARFSKDATDTVKETADSVNKTAGRAILENVIEPAEKASEAIKSAVGAGSQKASELAGDAKVEASKAADNASSTASKLSEDAKGAATNASYSAEQVKAEAGKKVNNAATEAKKATQ